MVFIAVIMHTCWAVECILFSSSVQLLRCRCCEFRFQLFENEKWSKKRLVLRKQNAANGAYIWCCKQFLLLFSFLFLAFSSTSFGRTKVLRMKILVATSYAIYALSLCSHALLLFPLMSANEYARLNVENVPFFRLFCLVRSSSEM